MGDVFKLDNSNGLSFKQFSAPLSNASRIPQHRFSENQQTSIAVGNFGINCRRFNRDFSGLRIAVVGD